MSYLPCSRADEQQLKSKLCALQTELLDFNRKISPSKRKGDLPEELASKDSLCSKSTSLLYKSARTFLILVGTIAWVMWPLCFPMVVYFGEGLTTFFWQIAIVSLTIVAFILARMTSDIYHFLRHWLARLSDAVRSYCLSKSNDGPQPEVFGGIIVLIAFLFTLVTSIFLLVRYNKAWFGNHWFCTILMMTCFLCSFYRYFSRKQQLANSHKYVPFGLDSANSPYFALPDLLSHISGKKTVFQLSPSPNDRKDGTNSNSARKPPRISLFQTGSWS